MPAPSAGPAAAPTPAAPPIASPASGAPRLVRYPYVQSCAADSIVVAWSTDVPADSVVEYGASPSLDFTVSSDDKVTLHAISLTGLAPETTYHYRVRGNGAILAEDTFRTNKLPSSASFSFVAFGDSGSGSDVQKQLAAVMVAADPDLAIHTGDVVYPGGQVENYGPNFFTPYKDLIASVCIFPVTGNHDLITDKGKPYFDVFHLPANNPQGTERYYSYDYGNAHFVALDSLIEKEGSAFEGPDAVAMKEWLIADLSGTDKLWKFVYLHNPPYSSGSKHGSYLNVRKVFSPIFEQYNVDIVFSGDDHSYERTHPIREFAAEGNGVIYVVTGGGGANTRPVSKSDFTAFSAQKHHFVHVKVTGETLTIEAIDQHGAVFDRHTIDRKARPQSQTSTSSVSQPIFLLVCASDTVGVDECDYTADGVDDQFEIKQAISRCPGVGCTIELANGTFRNRAPDEGDRIILSSNTRLVFSRGTHIEFTGSDEQDRYVIDVDGTVGLVENVYIGGPGLITVNRASDHGLRVKGDVRNVVIGDGLRLEHGVPEVSVDEGIQVTGSVDVRDLTIRDVYIGNFGKANKAAHGVEFAGLVRNSRIEGLTSVSNQHAIALRGDCDRAYRAFAVNAPLSITALSQAIDRKPETVASVALAGGDALLAMSGGRFNVLSFDLAAFNTLPAALSIAVSDGKGGWLEAALIRDGTSISGAAFAQDGHVEFAVPEDDLWAPNTIEGVKGYWARITASAELGPFGISELESCQTPHDNAIFKSTMVGSLGPAVSITSASRNTFSDLVIKSSAQTSVRSAKVPTAGRSWANSFVNVDIEDSGGAGYSFQESPESRVIGGRIRNSRLGIFQDGSTNEGSYYGGGLLIEGSQGSGIVIASDRTRVEGVTIRNSGASTALPDQGRAAIRILGGTGSAIINSGLADTQERPTQTYGIYIGLPARDTLIQGNSFSRNVIGPISNNGTGTVMRDNQGF